MIRGQLYKHQGKITAGRGDSWYKAQDSPKWEGTSLASLPLLRCCGWPRAANKSGGRYDRAKQGFISQESPGESERAVT